MRVKEIYSGERSPVEKRKWNRLHTAVLTGIAVFFCSTNSFDFLLFSPICIKLQQINALVKRRVRFLFVGKCQTPKYSICFQYGQAIYHRKAALSHELYTYYGLVKPPSTLGMSFCPKSTCTCCPMGSSGTAS